MSKAKKETVAQILARKKKNETTKPVQKKKTGVNATKKKKNTKKRTPINSDNKKKKDKQNSDINNLRNSQKYLDFIEFIATPAYLKEYESQKEFANEIGVGKDTLSKWKKDVSSNNIRNEQ